MSEYDGLISHQSHREWDNDDFVREKGNLGRVWSMQTVSEREKRMLIALLVAHAPDVKC